MSRYLTELAEVCRRTGWPVIEVDGWESRAHGSGGYGDAKPDHVICHHTASGPSSDGWPDVNYMTHNHDDAPLCNLYLDRSGTIWVCAAGATNTNGKGSDPCGVTSDDSMNSSAIGIEAGNSGTGEPWPQAQQDSYVALCAALCDAYLIPVGHVHAHFEWAPDRKIDPAGNSKYAPDAAMWNMDSFRGDVFAVQTGGDPPPPAYASGIDVSKWQGQIDWPQVQAAGYTWCATRTWDRDKHQVDETFHRNRDGMAFAQWRFLYYWLEPGRVDEGVDEFFQAVGSLRPGEGVMLDAEEDGITEDECVRWCEAVEARTGVPCAVYSGGYVAGGTIWKSSRIFDGHRARVFAAYCSEADAIRHAGGVGWDAWQYSASGRVPGIEPNCDLDRIDNGAAFTRCCLPTFSEEDDLTPEQAQQLSELHTLLTGPIYPERFKDPGGTPLNVPWGVGWTWEYVSQNVDQKLADIINRLDRLEQT